MLQNEKCANIYHENYEMQKMFGENNNGRSFSRNLLYITIAALISLLSRALELTPQGEHRGDRGRRGAGAARGAATAHRRCLQPDECFARRRGGAALLRILPCVR